MKKIVMGLFSILILGVSVQILSKKSISSNSVNKKINSLHRKDYLLGRMSVASSSLGSVDQSKSEKGDHATTEQVEKYKAALKVLNDPGFHKDFNEDMKKIEKVFSDYTNNILAKFKKSKGSSEPISFDDYLKSLGYEISSLSRSKE